jgi:hypothetical protein
MMKLTKISLLGVLLGVVSLFNVVLLVDNVEAADARNFNAGRIIDDGIFTNTSTMSVQDIQNFLESKVTCDTWGQERSELGGGTRAQWMNARGIYAPFRCMTDYKENPANGQNNYGKNETPAGAISAAQIIYNYSLQYGINPQVIIVTLQKENGMITDEWPSPKQFSEAMGFGCPDNVAPGAPACDPVYGSFSTQIYQAARHFRGFMDNSPGWFVPFANGNNFVRWNPTSSCGGGTVFIENRATVALYSYTPYQPNQAAKNAQYGLGDGCSAYGNRNFYLYFTDWFGSTIADVSITTPLKITSGHALGLYTKIPTKASFEITNNRGSSINIGGMSVAVRDSQGRNLDFALQNMVIPAYGRVQYQASQVLPEETYSFEIVNFSNGVWKSDYPRSYNSSYPRQVSWPVMEMPILTSGVSVDELRSEKDTIVSFSIKNNSVTNSVDIGKVGIGIRGPGGGNFDLASDTVILSPGQTYTYSKVFRPPYQGSYNFFVVSTLNNGLTWESNFPLPKDGTTPNTATTTARPGFTVTQSLQSSNPDPHTGQPTMITFKIKNFQSVAVDLGKVGIAGRDPLGRNVDPGIASVVLAPGEERTISFPITFDTVGVYHFGVIQTTNNGATWTSGPDADSGAVTKDINPRIKPSVTVIDGVSTSTPSITIGQSATLSFTVKNFSASPVNAHKIGLMGRSLTGLNVDPGVTPVSLAAGEERIVSFTFTPSVKGAYTFSLLGTPNNGAAWDNGPELEADSQQESVVVNVQ